MLCIFGFVHRITIIKFFYLKHFTMFYPLRVSGPSYLGLIDKGSVLPPLGVWAVPCSALNALSDRGSIPPVETTFGTVKNMVEAAKKKLKSSNPLKGSSSAEWRTYPPWIFDLSLFWNIKENAVTNPNSAVLSGISPAE